MSPSGNHGKPHCAPRAAATSAFGDDTPLSPPLVVEDLTTDVNDFGDAFAVPESSPQQGVGDRAAVDAFDFAAGADDSDNDSDEESLQEEDVSAVQFDEDWDAVRSMVETAAQQQALSPGGESATGFSADSSSDSDSD